MREAPLRRGTAVSSPGGPTVGPADGGSGGRPAGEGEIRVRVLLFGLFRELARTDEREVTLAEGATGRELVERLRGAGAMGFLPSTPTLAVNREYASLERPLRDGDEVALIPPVAGG